MTTPTLSPTVAATQVASSAPANSPLLSALPPAPSALVQVAAEARRALAGAALRLLAVATRPVENLADSEIDGGLPDARPTGWAGPPPRGLA